MKLVVGVLSGLTFGQVNGGGVVWAKDIYKEVLLTLTHPSPVHFHWKIASLHKLEIHITFHCINDPSRRQIEN